MPRGGKRRGAGRKSSWCNKETILIRVPKIIADQVLVIAHQIDAGEIVISPARLEQIQMDFLDGPGPLGQRDLARRFQLRSNGTVATNKKKLDWRKFAKWSYFHDPDDLHWAFDESIKKYCVIDYEAEVEKEIQH